MLGSTSDSKVSPEYTAFTSSEMIQQDIRNINKAGFFFDSLNCSFKGVRLPAVLVLNATVQSRTGRGPRPVGLTPSCTLIT